MKKSSELLVLLPFILFFVDAHVSDLISSMLPEGYSVVSHLFLLFFLILMVAFRSKGVICFFSLLLGLLFDYYYFDHIGILSLALPFGTMIVLGLLRFFSGSISQLQFFLFFTLYMFLVDVSSFILANSYQLTDMTFPYVMTFQLAPTLIVNLLILFCFRKLILSQFY